MTVFLDTHVAALVHAGDPEFLSQAVIHLLEASTDTRLSPIVVLELQYLHEIGRIAFGGEEIAGFLEAQFGMTVDTQGMGAATIHAVSLSWTRDPFDRIITAQAALQGAPLLTRDRTIRANYAKAIW